MVSAKCFACVFVLALSFTCQGAARQLRGEAISTARSAGGVAASLSIAAGPAAVRTNTVALKDGAAVAAQSATDGAHYQAVVAVADKVFKLQKDQAAKATTPGQRLSWDATPACPSTLSTKTAVKDASGRLWGWSNNKSCAFKSSGRSLLQAPAGSSNDVLTVTSTHPLTGDEPASAQKGSTKTTTYSGNVECSLDSVPDAATNTAHNVLKCVKKPGNSASNIVAITEQNPANVATAAIAGSAAKATTPGLKSASLSPVFKRPAAFKPAIPAPSSTSTHPGYVIIKDSPDPSPVVVPTAAAPQRSPSPVEASPAGYVIIKDSPAPSPVNVPNVVTPQASPAVAKASPAVVPAPAPDTQNNSPADDAPAANNSGANAATDDALSNSLNDYPQDSTDAETTTDDLDNFPGDSPFDVPPPNGLNDTGLYDDILPEGSPAVADDVAASPSPAVVPSPVKAQPSPVVVKASPAMVPSPVLPKPSPVMVKASPAVLPTPVVTPRSPIAVKASPAVVPSPAIPQPSPAVVNSSPVVPSPVLPPYDNAVPVPTAPLNTHDTEVLHTAINRFGSRWEFAPVCKTKPSKRTAVQDTMGRLWWFEDGISCAYRTAQGTSMFYDGYVQVKWETAQACKATPTLINAMTDAEGRLWGWTGAGTADGNNCKFVDAAGKAVKQEDILAQIIHLAAAESTQLN